MFGRMTLAAIVAAVVLGLVFWGGKLFNISYEDVFPGEQTAAKEKPAEGQSKSDRPSQNEVVPSKPKDIGKKLYAGEIPASRGFTPLDRKPGVYDDPIVIPDCRLDVIGKQEVPSQREGVIDFIGTDITGGREGLFLMPLNLGTALLTAEVVIGEDPAIDRTYVLRTANGQRKYRRLFEDDIVEKGHLLAMVDNRLALDEVAIKQSKVDSSIADFVASEKTRDEAKRRLETQAELWKKRATSFEEYSGAKLTYDKYFYEAISKEKAILLARAEMRQAYTQLGMHEIRSKNRGVIKSILRRDGEAVKNLDQVFLIKNLERLRAIGLVDVQHKGRLEKGMTVVIEPSISKDPVKTFIGHLQEITGVAVSQDPNKPLIASSSEDGTVRVWDRMAQHELHRWVHSAPVRAVACAAVNLRAGHRANVCLSGTAEGKVYVWDLDSDSAEPLQVLEEKHRGAINCVAFSRDGAWLATGGQDREIRLWELDQAQGQYQFKYRLEAGQSHSAHKAEVTSVQFTPDSQLVSVAKDNTLRLWTLGTDNGVVQVTFDRRSNDVGTLGLSPDGKHVLFDPAQSNTLRILSLPGGQTEAVLQNLSGGAAFTTMALFSPDASLILTAGRSDSRLQLWRTPTAANRPYELCQLVPSEKSAAPTCGAFSPDGSFIVTGTKDRKLLVWQTPSKSEVERRITAELTNIDRILESNGKQVKIWAEMKNPGFLSPGGSVTVVVYPR